MKRTLLIFTLILVFMLSACGTSQPYPSAEPSQMVEIPSLAAEPSVESEPHKQSNEPMYSEVLTTYSSALAEEWKGSTLIEKGFDPLLADCYGDMPLENIGYLISDLDNDGIQELVIGTTERVQDAFYGKLILALYTQDAGGKSIPVFRSAERDRYYYAGSNRFAHLGSSGADDSFETTEDFMGSSLHDINSVTNVENYVQMNLIPMSQWMQMIDLPDPEKPAQVSALPILDEIDQNTTAGTAGSFMTAVQSAVKLLDWGVNTGLDSEEIKEAARAWLENKGNDEQVAFAQKLTLVDEAYQKLLTDNAETLLASAGLEDTERFWPDSPVEPIEEIMSVAGLR